MDPDRVSEPAAAYGEVKPLDYANRRTGLEAFIMAQDQLQERLRRVTALLDAARIPYALIGGNAVAFYVGQVDPEAVRTTADVDILMNSDDIPRAAEVLESQGMKYRHAAGVHMFLDSPTASARSAVHVIFTGQKIRPDYPVPAPTLEVVHRGGSDVAVIPLPRLVEMKLTSFRDKDKMHLRDMIDVGLLPGKILESLPPVLRERLQYLLDNPE